MAYHADDADVEGGTLLSESRGGLKYPWGKPEEGPAPNLGWRTAFLATVGAVFALSVGLGTYGYVSGAISVLIHRSAGLAESSAVLGGASMGSLVLVVLLGAACGLIASAGAFAILVCAGGLLIDVGLWAFCALAVLTAIAFATAGNPFGAIIMGIAAIVVALVPCLTGAGLVLARAMLTSATRVVSEYFGLIGTAAAAAIAQVVFAAIWAQAMLGVLALGGSGTSRAVEVAVSAAGLGLLLALLWVAGVIANVVAVTTARVTAVWWGQGGGGAEGAVVEIPSAASAASAAAAGRPATSTADGADEASAVVRARQWAQWSALGPVSCATFVVAALQCVELAVGRGRRTDGTGGGGLCTILCFCCLRAARRSVQYYNSYLFAVLGVAHSGRTLSVGEASEIVFSLTTLGTTVSAVFNDFLINLGLTATAAAGILASALLGAGAAAGVSAATAAVPTASRVLSGACVASAVVVGVVTMITVVGVLHGSVKALFVLFVASHTIGPGTSAFTADPDAGDLARRLSPLAVRPGGARVEDVSALEKAVSDARSQQLEVKAE